MSVCSEKMLNIVPLLGIVLSHVFRTLAIIVPCTIVGYAVPVRGILFFPCSYGFLICPPTSFGLRFSLLTLRFRRDCLCHFRSRSIVSHHGTDGEILARSLSLPLLWGFTSSFQMELDACGASLVEESFTLHLSLHSRPSLCTHEAVSSVRSNVFCVHDIWLLRLLFYFSIAKLRQDVYLKYRLGYLHHKKIGSLPHFPVWLLVKRVFQHFCSKLFAFCTSLAHFREAL